MTNRPKIPAELERRLMLDAGYRCSVPTCRESTSLEIDHIVDWSEVTEHRYENLIVLCPNHHAMKTKGSKPRELNAKSLHIIKQNQIELAGRYGDIERRVIDFFVRNPGHAELTLPGDFDILLMNLLEFGLLEKRFDADGSTVLQMIDNGDEPTPENSIVLRQVYRLTDEGLTTVDALREEREMTMP